jgi:hypothetical protein
MITELKILIFFSIFNIIVLFFLYKITENKIRKEKRIILFGLFYFIFLIPSIINYFFKSQ